MRQASTCGTLSPVAGRMLAQYRMVSTSSATSPVNLVDSVNDIICGGTTQGADNACQLRWCQAVMLAEKCALEEVVSQLELHEAREARLNVALGRQLWLASWLASWLCLHAVSWGCSPDDSTEAFMTKVTGSCARMPSTCASDLKKKKVRTRWSRSSNPLLALVCGPCGGGHTRPSHLCSTGRHSGCTQAWPTDL